MPVIELVDLRDAAATVLEPMLDDDPPVVSAPADSVTPPVYMVAWSDPWLDPGPSGPTMGACIWTAHLAVWCLAPRVEPGAGTEILEQMVSVALGRFRADTYPWPAGTVTGPRQFNTQGLSYLGSRIDYPVPITV